jgi:hypothetical protein
VGLHFVEEAKQATEILWGTPKSKLQQEKSMFVEGLLPKLTFAVAGSKSLAQMSWKVCSFWETGNRRVRVPGDRSKEGGMDGRVVG